MRYTLFVGFAQGAQRRENSWLNRRKDAREDKYLSPKGYNPKEGYGSREEDVSVSLMTSAITAEQKHKLNDRFSKGGTKQSKGVLRPL